MNRTFIDRVTATTQYGVMEARHMRKCGYAPKDMKVAVKIGETVYEAQGKEVLHAQIACRAWDNGAEGEVVDGFTVGTK